MSIREIVVHVVQRNAAFHSAKITTEILAAAGVLASLRPLLYRLARACRTIGARNRRVSLYCCFLQSSPLPLRAPPFRTGSSTPALFNEEHDLTGFATFRAGALVPDVIPTVDPRAPSAPRRRVRPRSAPQHAAPFVSRAFPPPRSRNSVLRHAHESVRPARVHASPQTRRHAMRRFSTLSALALVIVMASSVYAQVAPARARQRCLSYRERPRSGF